MCVTLPKPDLPGAKKGKKERKKRKKKKQFRHRDALQPKTQPTNEVIKSSIHFKRSKCFLHFKAKHGRWGGEVQIIEDESTKGKSGKDK